MARFTHLIISAIIVAAARGARPQLLRALLIVIAIRIVWTTPILRTLGNLRARGPVRQLGALLEKGGKGSARHVPPGTAVIVATVAAVALPGPAVGVVVVPAHFTRLTVVDESARFPVAGLLTTHARIAVIVTLTRGAVYSSWRTAGVPCPALLENTPKFFA